MKPGKEGYRVAVIGASSLLGKELVAVLEHSKFPVSRLLTFEAEEGEPELPIIDLSAASGSVVEDGLVSSAELDIAFVCGRFGKPPAFLASLQQEGHASPCLVLDLVGDGMPAGGANSTQAAEGLVGIPFLDRRYPVTGIHASAGNTHVSPHAAVIVISSLLLRLAARFPLKSAVAQVFTSASECGSRGVEELQKQTMNILSFQKVPQQIFGSQLAFNLLPRLGKSGSKEMAALETRVRGQLRRYLGDRVPLPAVRFVQVPAFYSISVSLYVEAAAPVSVEAASAALSGERIKIRKPTLDAPTPVEATGSGDILVDAISADPDHSQGLWIWAVADNLQLTATNALELAASLREQARA